MFVVRAEVRTCRAWAGAPTADEDLEGHELFESVEPTLLGVRECAELAERRDARWR